MLNRWFLTDNEVFHLGWNILAPWDLWRKKLNFSILQVLLFHFSSFIFRFSKFVSNTFHLFHFQGLILWFPSNIEVSRFRWSTLEPWDIVKCKSYFSVFHNCNLYFWFFDRLIIFFWCNVDSCYLWLILIGFTMGEGLERFFRALYQIFPQDTMHNISYVTILLLKFFTISNALLLLVPYQMCYCMPYHTFLMK